MDYRGVIIEESLADTAVLRSLHIVETKVEPVTERHQTPWVTQWTKHIVEVPETDITDLAEQLSRTLDPKHSWYIDFKTSYAHVIIFYRKVFWIDRTMTGAYEDAIQYGLALGIPGYQLDFSPEVD